MYIDYGDYNDDDYEGVDVDALEEYPEADEIVDEAVQKLRAFFRKERNKLYSEVEQKEEKLKQIAEEQKQRNSELLLKASSLAQRESELGKKEEELYDKFKRRWAANLGLEWKLGDVVYYYKVFNKENVCPVCHGRKKLTATLPIGGTVEINCPCCRGWGKTTTEITGEIKRDRVRAIGYSVYIDKDAVQAQGVDAFVKPETPDIYLEYDYNTNGGSILLYRDEEECKAALEELITKKNKELQDKLSVWATPSNESSEI